MFADWKKELYTLLGNIIRGGGKKLILGLFPKDSRYLYRLNGIERIANESNSIIKTKIIVETEEPINCEFPIRTGIAKPRQVIIISIASTRFLLRFFDNLSDLSQQDLQINILSKIFL